MAGSQGGRRPLCFVLMPFGAKAGPAGGMIEFDEIYEQLIRPAVEDAGMQALRADEERSGGMIHKPMFERLVLSEYAVADLTLANANVYYELGVRHAVRPHSTVLMFARDTRLPFDLGPMRGLAYAPELGDSAEDRRRLAGALRDAREAATDSPLFQLLTGMAPPDLSRLKTDVFRDEVDYSERMKARLAEARGGGVEAVRQVEAELGPLADAEAGVVVDLLLSYRAVKAWDAAVDLVERMPAPLSRSVMVREQYALALNRAGRGERAEQVLLDLLASQGPSSETFGILGRVYKDRWQAARAAGQDLLAAGLLDRAIDAYVRGFETDWRDAYPGVNAVTLMELRDPPDPRREELLPVVAYSVRRRIDAGRPDYWDHATLLELALLDGDRGRAAAALTDTLAAVREVWEPETTLNNVRELNAARRRRGTLPDWAVDIESALEQAATT